MIVAEQATTQLIKMGISSLYVVLVHIITQMKKSLKMAEKIVVLIIGIIAMRGVWAIVMDIYEILSGE